MSVYVIVFFIYFIVRLNRMKIVELCNLDVSVVLNFVACKMNYFQDMSVIITINRRLSAFCNWKVTCVVM